MMDEVSEEELSQVGRYKGVHRQSVMAGHR